MSTPWELSWDGSGREHVNADAALSEAITRTRELDGAGRSVLITQSGRHRLTIGGDAEKGLVVFAETGDGLFHQLLNPTATDSTKKVVAGGQPGEYSARHVVDIDAALTALSTFLKQRTLDPSLSWEAS